MTAARPTSKQQQSGGFSAIFPYIIIPILLIIAVLIWKFYFGTPSHFVSDAEHPAGNPALEPKDGNILGTIYKGGYIVPLLMTAFFTVIVFIIERFITLAKAGGSTGADTFVRGIKNYLDRNDISGAMAACDKQKGAIANVVRAGLGKYAEMEQNKDLDRDQKVLAIQKEVEEATTLELPMLEKNLNILATIASIATLLGLLGTVIGMIRSFAALANAGAPDSTALATGISEALINTALGIATSAIAIIFYNFFTSRIDAMTYRIDEAGYSLTQTFASKNH